MAYCTASAVSARLPAVGLAKDQAAMAVLIEEGISWADAQIDSRLGSRYTVPFTDVPTLVRHISADLAASFVIDSSLSGGGEDDSNPLSKRYAARAEQALLNILSGSDIVSAVTAVVPTVPPAYHTQMGQKQILERYPVQQDWSSRRGRQIDNPLNYPADNPLYPPYPY